MSTVDPMEQIATLIPGSRVSVSFTATNPPEMPWVAWLDHWPKGSCENITVGAMTRVEALRALMEQVRAKSPKPALKEF